jgi:hypothetical protein
MRRTKRSCGRPQSLTTERKAQMIEYWVNNTDKTLIYIARRFKINVSTLSNILTRDYLSKKLYASLGLTTITLQSKINEPELETII